MATAALIMGKLDGLRIDRDSGAPLYQQLEEALRRGVESGSIGAGARLPAIQELATQLQVSRNTVRRAYQNLAAAGFLEGSAGSGFRARSSASELAAASATSEFRAPSAPEPPTVTFDRPAALEQIEARRLHIGETIEPFQPELPDTQEFPLDLWEGLRAQTLKEHAPELLRHTSALGYLPLREAIAGRLRRVRGVKCIPEQVIVSAGLQPALHLIIQTLLSPGDAVGMEEPGLYRAKAAFLQAGARVLPMLVDEEGMLAPEGRRQNPPALLYVTPANQFPLGVRLSLARRSALLEFARDTGAWIIEDDRDGDLSHSSASSPSLQSADEHDRVLYLGTTGRTLFPSLEIGYAIVPRPLLESFSKVKELLGGQPCAIDQATLAQFISGGHLDEHVHRLNALYYERMQVLAESVDSELDEFIQLEPADAGSHAVGWLKRGLDEQSVAACAAEAGVQLPALSDFGRTALMRPGVVFGFGGFGEKQIRGGVKKLRQALQAKAASAGARSGLLDRFLRRA